MLISATCNTLDEDACTRSGGKGARLRPACELAWGPLPASTKCLHSFLTPWRGKALPALVGGTAPAVHQSPFYGALPSGILQSGGGCVAGAAGRPPSCRGGILEATRRLFYYYTQTPARTLPILCVAYVSALDD